MTPADADILFADTDGLRRAAQHFSPESMPSLRTEPNAVARLGPAYLRAAVDEVVGEAGFDTALIDCGDDPGLVLKALAEGWRHVAFSGDALMSEKLAAIAGNYGAALYQEAGETGYSEMGSR